MICYHGTTKECYEKIIKEGAKPFTHWTPFLSSALTMGGPYVVAAFFTEVDEGWLGKGGWEWLNKETVPPEKFVMTGKYEMQLLTYHGDAAREVADWYRKKEGYDTCEECDGHGELGYVDDGHWWRIGGSRFDDRVYQHANTPRRICSKCGGYGSPKRFIEMTEA